MSGAAWKGAVVLLAGGIALFAARTVGAVRAYAAAPEVEGRVAAQGERGFRPALPADGTLAEVAAPGRAVVFVYSPECGASRDNMWNWTDAVRAADGSVRFYAVAPRRDPEARGYWAGLARRVAVVDSDTATVGRAFRLGVTPATVLVADGRVEAVFLGPLTPAARERVLRFVRGSPGGGRAVRGG